MTIGEIKKKRALEEETDLGLTPVKNSKGETLFKTNGYIDDLDINSLEKIMETELNKIKSL